MPGWRACVSVCVSVCVCVCVGGVLWTKIVTRSFERFLYPGSCFF